MEADISLAMLLAQEKEYKEIKHGIASEKVCGDKYINVTEMCEIKSVEQLDNDFMHKEGHIFTHSTPNSERVESRRGENDSLGYDSGGSTCDSGSSEAEEANISIPSRSITSSRESNRELYHSCMVRSTNQDFGSESWEDVDSPILRHLTSHSGLMRSYHESTIYEDAKDILDNNSNISHFCPTQPDWDKSDQTTSGLRDITFLSADLCNHVLYHSTMSSHEQEGFEQSTCSEQSYDSSVLNTSEDEEMSSNRKRRKRFVSNTALLNCLKHCDAKESLFCQECSQPMCYWCKINNHKNHEYTTIDSAGIERHGFLRRQKRHIKKKRSEFEKKIDELKNYEQDLNEKRKLVEQKLNTKKDYLHDIVDRWYNKMSLKIDATWSHEMTQLMAHIDEIESSLSEMDACVKKIKETLICRQPTELLRDSKELLQTISTLSEMQVSQPQQNICFIFAPGIHLEYYLFGDFTTGAATAGGNRTKLIAQGRELLSFDSRDLKSSNYMATGLSLTPDDEIIVTDLGLDMINIFSPIGKKMCTLNTLPQDQPTKTVKKGGNFVVACKSGLKIYDAKGNFGHKIETCLETPQGIVQNRNGDLVVTDTDENGSSLIHIFANADLRNLHTIIGGKHAPAFKKPWYCAIDEQNNIIVSDREEHTIKILNAVGMVICEFGQKGYKPGCFFHPAGVCVDSFGHILVADCYNSRVQLFSKEGHFLGVILNEENDLSFPTDLAIDKQGHLVVLQGNGEVKVFQYMY